MGISSNQARFLALTSRQVDLEHRIQQICQRRLRLASSLENTATSYNNQISNRQMYKMKNTGGGIETLSVANITSMKDENGNNYILMVKDKSTSQVTSGKYVSNISSGGAFAVGSFGISANYSTYTLSDLGLPTGASDAQVIDAGLRQGILLIASTPDEFTQSKTEVVNGDVTGTSAGFYEVQDWRTLPQFADELYNGDDVDAENKYDKTINEINAQDKKLQLEQTSIEVEYKAITSEKESVKKVLDTNAQSSFKYFS